ncbi:MAG: AbrB/MazE/SpoVT family DNA-binding domain-containing protein [Planctomycetaceae bacterium]|nr:AbrB/MazE/SpoVT family DNA-binding domain-containing protein [Planctomycetaceae bacterium]
MRTALSTKGQIVLPVELREQDQLQPGQLFEVERVQEGEYVLRKLLPAGPSGLMAWLGACPVKDWYEPISAESTAEIERRVVKRIGA